jgi:choice-of-anchor B domain-containing protein
MRNLYIFFFFTFISLNIKAQFDSQLLFHWNDSTIVGSQAYNNAYNEIWGININNSEIAIIGSTSGTHFFDVTNPQNSTEVAFLSAGYTGTGVIHRDYHDFNGFLYIVCDEGSSSTLQIVDISNLPNSINTVYDSNSLFTKAHNIFIDTASAKMYACASNNAMDVYSLHVPSSPALIYSYSSVGHVHDAYVRNDTAYLNCGNQGLRVMDFSMVNNLGDQPQQLASLISYPDAGYNHSGWLSDDGSIYAMQDENHGYDIKILDVSDLNNISVIATFNSGVDSQSMAHNGIIKGDLLYVAYYHDGLRVFDISDPNNPVQVNSYDTYAPNNHTSYRGAWGVYPYLNSGNILVSDMQSGLYVLDMSNSSTTTFNIVNSKHNIYPNPAGELFHIKDHIGDVLEIYDFSGKRVMKHTIKNSISTFSTKDFKSGIYLYEIKDHGIVLESGKIIFD